MKASDQTFENLQCSWLLASFQCGQTISLKTLKPKVLDSKIWRELWVER